MTELDGFITYLQHYFHTHQLTKWSSPKVYSLYRDYCSNHDIKSPLGKVIFFRSLDQSKIFCRIQRNKYVQWNESSIDDLPRPKKEVQPIVSTILQSRTPNYLQCHDVIRPSPWNNTLTDCIDIITEQWTPSHIIHLADLHLKPNQRHEEYETFFQQWEQQLRSLVISSNESWLKDAMIVLVGDIADSFESIRPETQLLLHRFFSLCSQLVPHTVLITGNHDMAEQNLSLLDVLVSPTLGLDPTKFHYLRYSGLYQFGRTLFSVSSLVDQYFITRSDIPDTLLSTHSIHHVIALYHGALVGAKMNQYRCVEEPSGTSSRYRNKKDFKGFDAVLLGDIHIPQQIGKKPPIYYAGSPLEVKYDERLYQHGFYIWNIPSSSSSPLSSEYPIRIPQPTFYPIPNDYEWTEIHIDSSKWINQKDIEQKGWVPYPKIRYHIKSILPPSYTILEKIKESISHSLRQQHPHGYLTEWKKYQPPRRSTQLTSSDEKHPTNLQCDDEKTNQTKEEDISLSIMNPEKFFHQYLSELNEANQLIPSHKKDLFNDPEYTIQSELETIHKSYLSRLGTPSSFDYTETKGEWMPLRLWFVGLFNFTEPISISLEDGLTLITAENMAGKTSLLKSLLCSIWGYVPNQDLRFCIHQTIRQFHSYIELSLNGQRYTIERKGNLTKDGKVKTKPPQFKVHFSSSSSSSSSTTISTKNTFTLLNENSKVTTEKKIQSYFGTCEQFVRHNLMSPKIGIQSTIMELKPKELKEHIISVFQLNFLDILQQENSSQKQTMRDAFHQSEMKWMTLQQERDTIQQKIHTLQEECSPLSLTQVKQHIKTLSNDVEKQYQYYEQIWKSVHNLLQRREQIYDELKQFPSWKQLNQEYQKYYSKSLELLDYWDTSDNQPIPCSPSSEQFKELCEKYEHSQQKYMDISSQQNYHIQWIQEWFNPKRNKNKNIIKTKDIRKYKQWKRKQTTEMVDISSLRQQWIIWFKKEHEIQDKINSLSTEHHHLKMNEDEIDNAILQLSEEELRHMIKERRQKQEQRRHDMTRIETQLQSKDISMDICPSLTTLQENSHSLITSLHEIIPNATWWNEPFWSSFQSIDTMTYEDCDLIQSKLQQLCHSYQEKCIRIEQLQNKQTSEKYQSYMDDDNGDKENRTDDPPLWWIWSFDTYQEPKGTPQDYYHQFYQSLPTIPNKRETKHSSEKECRRQRKKLQRKYKEYETNLHLGTSFFQYNPNQIDSWYRIIEEGTWSFFQQSSQEKKNLLTFLTHTKHVLQRQSYQEQMNKLQENIQLLDKEYEDWKWNRNYVDPIHEEYYTKTKINQRIENTYTYLLTMNQHQMEKCVHSIKKIMETVLYPFKIYHWKTQWNILSKQQKEEETYLQQMEYHMREKQLSSYRTHIIDIQKKKKKLRHILLGHLDWLQTQNEIHKTYTTTLQKEIDFHRCFHEREYARVQLERYQQKKEQYNCLTEDLFQRDNPSHVYDIWNQMNETLQYYQVRYTQWKQYHEQYKSLSTSLVETKKEYQNIQHQRHLIYLYEDLFLRKGGVKERYMYQVFDLICSHVNRFIHYMIPYRLCYGNISGKSSEGFYLQYEPSDTDVLSISQDTLPMKTEVGYSNLSGFESCVLELIVKNVLNYSSSHLKCRFFAMDEVMDCFDHDHFRHFLRTFTNAFGRLSYDKAFLITHRTVSDQGFRHWVLDQGVIHSWNTNLNDKKKEKKKK